MPTVGYQLFNLYDTKFVWMTQSLYREESLSQEDMLTVH